MFYFNTRNNGYIESIGLWGCIPGNDVTKIKQHINNNNVFPTWNYCINGSLVIKALQELSLITLEVTKGCNLKCKYCIHGDLYKCNETFVQKQLSTEHIISLIDYLVDYWEKQGSTPIKSTNIGFHGGEPLVNFKLIQDVVEYTKSIDPSVRKFTFSIFTNGVLLDKYIDYLVDNNIHLSVSLDGNKYNNSYRVYPNGIASFDRVTQNLDMIKEKYPVYFNSMVKFTSVLHDRNNPEEIRIFFQNRYGKLPSVNELESFDLNEDKLEEFKKMFSANKKENFLLMGEADDKAVIRHIINRSNNVFDNYNDLLHKSKKPVYLTQTCQPFGKKLFLSANSEIAFCQTIYKKHTVGYVSDTGVHLDPKKIADDYNNLVKKMLAECQECYMPEECSQCMLKLVEEGSDRPVCPKRVTKEMYTEYVSKIWNYLEAHPETYTHFIEEHNPKQAVNG